MPSIGIDTNVFEHLLNPVVNTDSHIDRLLGVLTRASYQLLVDSTRKIANEYQQSIIPMIKNMDETRPQLPVLRHWMSLEIRDEVAVDPRGSLMQAIRRVIAEKEKHADRAFVYVTCCTNATLVTNDRADILDRRQDLLKATKRLRGKDTSMHSSQEAAVHFCDYTIES